MNDKKHNGLIALLFVKVISLAGGIKKGFMNVMNALMYLGGHFMSYLRFFLNIYHNSRLDEREKELMVAHLAWRTGCRYEFVHHTEQAEKHGITNDDMISVCCEPEEIEDAHTQLLMQCVDDLVLNFQIPEERLQVLRLTYEDKEIVEITMFLGHYMMVAGFNNTLVNLESSKEYTVEE